MRTSAKDFENAAEIIASFAMGEFGTPDNPVQDAFIMFFQFEGEEKDQFKNRVLELIEETTDGYK